ncbi:MAG TPA: crossover junction endodeoxyribonuclease RuvC, partial [Tepidiformaceae bacterium]|nr:crossover junction endodeoxyribonuclease RuvC [Tepidiformaceae bacterium]
MRILGVDPGLNVTGYGVVEVAGDSCRHIHHGVVRTKASEPMGDRLAAIRDGIRGIARQWEVESAAVEASFMGSNARSALALGQARAA